jgi:hypothetical protein
MFLILADNASGFGFNSLLISIDASVERRLWDLSTRNEAYVGNSEIFQKIRTPQPSRGHPIVKGHQRWLPFCIEWDGKAW